MTTVSKRQFGKTGSGQDVAAISLENSNGVKLDLLDYGATIRSIQVPNVGGRTVDVVLGYDDMQGYLAHTAYMGAVCGRVANRVTQGQFQVEGKQYSVTKNCGEHQLHGGLVGFDKMIWKFKIDESDGVCKVVFSLRSPDGDEGYPGNLDVTVTYQLLSDNSVVISYTATTDKTTPVNLTNHAYFNLGGHESGVVNEHVFTINADKYTPKNEHEIPNGDITSVEETVFDLREPVRLGDRINEIPGGGYDHNFCVNHIGLDKPCASVSHPIGLLMDVCTTKPGLQFYTGNFLDGQPNGKGGSVYKKHFGFALETQHFPDAVNKSNFPDSLLRPGETYNHTTIYRFTVK